MFGSYIYNVAIATKSLKMIGSTFLFSPVARVWNLRSLLVGTLAIICFWVVSDVQAAPYGVPVWVVLATMGFCLMFLHHLLVVARWPFRGLAVLELGWTLGTCCLGFTLLLYVFPLLVPLSLSVLFRIATIKNSGEPLLRQRFVFLGGCSRTHPPYTPLSILLNRSISRPLVRGESMFVIVPRGIVISIIGAALFAFLIYLVLVAPSTTPIYERSIRLWDDVYIPGNATILLTTLFSAGASGIPDVSVATYAPDVEALKCVTTWTLEGTSFCPVGWKGVVSISISIALQEMREVYATPVQGKLSEELQYLSVDYCDTGAGLFPGSRLLGVFTWTRRDTLNLRSSRWATPSWISVFIADVSGLQTVPANGTLESNIATLTLFQRDIFATKVVQDTVDATAVTGIATFGGVWTFLNGAFTLFFGANVLYFSFGRRPLSALGIVHMCQRRRLIRQWHEDFPDIHTEEGRPGSESAGIVAFIRERLVDLGEDPRGTEPRQSDVEAQTSKVETKVAVDDTSSVTLPVVLTPEPSGIHPASKYLKQSGYILDEEAPLVVNFGANEVSDGHMNLGDK
ncbi:Short-chain dehydrogenase/reductase family protein [Mycena venus]|uniref:Short-chain dehydrogenase/reductase family protein n=1 Tax=Mycena venus TaxID=2733690 RepID=A0A8H6YAZ8_9AGAR|nr:Short-chain dehydrogenase/reductase family protein [Mycena venus]